MDNSQAREKAVFEAINNGNWDQAIHHAKHVPTNWDIWQRLPSSAKMPDEAVHKILDVLTKDPRQKNNLASFIYEYSNHIPEHVSQETLNHIADVHTKNGGSHLETKNILAHPNFKYNEKNASLKRAADFWSGYEKKVEPHHFATVKSMFTGKPESLTDHRGNKGSSTAHESIIPDIQNHAKEVQSLILNDEHTPKRYINDEPHVLLYRGVGGLYGRKIWEKANHDPKTKQMDKKAFVLPTAHLTSWTTDPEMAGRFAWGRGEIPGQPEDKGVVLKQWVPVKHILHSGTHSSVAGQNHVHPSEYEIVVGHPEGKIKTATTNMQFQEPPKYDDSSGRNFLTNYGKTYTPKMRKSEEDFEYDLRGIEIDIELVELNKSMKKLLPAATALALLGAPQEMSHIVPVEHMPASVQQVTEPQSALDLRPDQESEVPSGLKAIKMIESSGGTDTNHKKINTGIHAGTRAYGKYGLMPLTISETVNRNPSLSIKYQGLLGLHYQKDHDLIHKFMHENPKAELDVAKAHWKKLRDAFGGNRNKMAYAWYNGIAGARHATDDQINNHPYVQKFNKYRKMLELEGKHFKKSQPSLENQAQIEGFVGFSNVPQDKDSVSKINEAIKSGKMHNLSNVGKFTHDSFIAGFDPDNSWLIKVEPFGHRAKSMSVRYGLQTVKEAAFYQIADKVFGLANYTPHAILGEVLMDGEHMPAVAIKMYPKVFVSAVDLEKQRPHAFRAILEKYRRSGDLDKMAALLYVLGDADSHGNNVMTDGQNIKLIDHGTSFADMTFDPAHDDAVFVPYILRAWGYKDRMDSDEKLKHLPQIDSEEVKGRIRHWVLNLNEHELLELLQRFNIDPKPSMTRLRVLKKIVSNGDPDNAINTLWSYGGERNEAN